MKCAPKCLSLVTGDLNQVRVVHVLLGESSPSFCPLALVSPTVILHLCIKIHTVFFLYFVSVILTIHNLASLPCYLLSSNAYTFHVSNTFTVFIVKKKFVWKYGVQFYKLMCH